MAYSLVWTFDVLVRAGLKVAPVQGWETRGTRDVGTTLGVLCHHTGAATIKNMPRLNMLVRGRPDLPGPLAHLGLGRDGTFYVIAAGRANHAGVGEWNGVTSGNDHFIGIEAENTGTHNDQWPDVQLDAYRRGVAALLGHLKLSANACAGHKEYARPLGRKPDPSFDMQAFRNQVAEILAGSAPQPVLIPLLEPTPGGRVTIRRGSAANPPELVSIVQKKLGMEATGTFNARLEALVRAFQRTEKLVPDGIVGPKTWKELDRRS